MAIIEFFSLLNIQRVDRYCCSSTQYVHVSLTPNSRCSLYVQVFPTALRNSGINVAAVVSMVVGMSAPYAIDFTRVECFTSKMTFLTTLQLKIVK